MDGKQGCCTIMGTFQSFHLGSAGIHRRAESMTNTSSAVMTFCVTFQFLYAVPALIPGKTDPM
jgi:FAD synthase